MDDFIGQIIMTGFNFAPRNYALCNGQILPIAQNTALFALLGTQYGGNGTTTFGLPDLQGRVPLGRGQGPGLSERVVGQAGGSRTVTLLVNNMPAHAHTGGAAVVQPSSSEAANSGSPDGRVPANTGSLNRYAPTADASMAAYPVTLSPAGGGQPFPIMQPTLTISYAIALQGIFPARS